MKRCSETIDPPGVRVSLRVGARLDAGWSSWFEGMTVTVSECGESRLNGVVADQAALHGLLSRIRDLGVPLLGLEAAAEAGDSVCDEPWRRGPEGSERRIEPPSGPRPT